MHAQFSKAYVSSQAEVGETTPVTEPEQRVSPLFGTGTPPRRVLIRVSSHPNHPLSIVSQKPT